MAYRPRRRTTYRARSTRGTTYARRTSRPTRRTSRRRVSASPRSIRIEVVSVPASPVARPDMYGMKAAPAPRQRKF